MHKIYVEALAEMMKEYGLRVCVTPNGPELFWELYVQGSGVCFSAELVDFKPVAAAMFEAGNLPQAALVKRLADNHGLTFAVRQRDHRTTHAYTMDVESAGPTTDCGVDPTTVVQAIEGASQVLKDLCVKASVAAQQLLEDWFALSEPDLKEVRTYTTERFKVEVHKQSGDEGEDLLAHDLELLTPAEALAFMRQSVSSEGATSFRLRVVVSKRGGACSCNCNWVVLTSAEVDGGVFTKADVRTVVRNAIRNARNILQTNQPDLREAA